jgi:hypothetical protein
MSNVSRWYQESNTLFINHCIRIDMSSCIRQNENVVITYPLELGIWG